MLVSMKPASSSSSLARTLLLRSKASPPVRSMSSMSLWNRVSTAFQKKGGGESADINEDKPLVTITGLDGYVGPWTALSFLRDGNFRVRGTVRRNPCVDKMRSIEDAFGPDLMNRMEIVEAELLDEASMDNAISGSSYVAHLASPYYLNNKTRAELTEPAIRGTLTTLESCVRHAVKRCVFTSSYACIRWTSDPQAKNKSFDESVWSDLNLVGDYAASKLEAEKAGWDFAKRHSDVLEVSTVCPTMITGPAIGNPNVVSEEFMTSLMYNQPTGVKLASNYYVDVRDVAKAHYRAVVVPEAANRRFLVHGTQPYTLDEICSLIDSTFPGKFRPAGHDGMDGSAAIGISNDNSASRDVLGMDYVPFEDTVKDMIDSLIRSGKITEIEQKLQHQEAAAAQQEVLAVA